LLGRVKQALFSTLEPLRESCEFLDLFAGSGSVGIEALSRGVATCTFVERDARCVQIIKENLRALGFYDQATVMRAYVRSGLQRLDKGARQFDLIFIGPPYGQNLAHQTLIQLAQLSVLRQDGIIIAQTGRREKLDDRYGDLELLRSRSYGDTTLQFYHKRSG
jgi:16S rRNA (guanine966-N2)-methyltransferase